MMMSWHRNNSTWDRGGKKSEESVARVVAAILGAWAAGREEKHVFFFFFFLLFFLILFITFAHLLLPLLPTRNSDPGSHLRGDGSFRATSSAGKSLHVKPRQPCSRKEETYIFTVPFSRGKHIYRPASPKKNKITVLSRRGKKFLPSRPAEG